MKMSFSDTEKHEIKPVRDVIFCMPPKKRHLLRLQSPLSMSPAPATWSPGDRYQPDKGCHLHEPEGFDLQAGAGTNVSESRFFDTSSSSSTLKSSPDQEKQEGPPAVCVTGMDANTNGNLSRQDATEYVTKNTEMQSAAKKLNVLPTTNEIGEELYQAEEHEKKPSILALKSFAVENCSKMVNPVKRETLTPCSEDARIGEDYLNKQASLHELCSDRSNWDLNTMMDSWEDPDQLGSLEDTCKKGTSGPRDNHGSVWKGHFSSESNVELGLTSGVENIAVVNQMRSNHSSIPNSGRDTSNLNLSMTLTYTPISSSLADSNANDNLFDQGPIDKMDVGKKNFIPMLLKNVKNEPSEVPVAKNAIKKSAEAVLPNSLMLVYSTVVKSETPTETSQIASYKMQGKDQLTESPCHSPRDPLKFKQILQERTEDFEPSTLQASTGDRKNVDFLSAEMPSKGSIQHIGAPQIAALCVSRESICKVKLELPEGNLLGTGSSADVLNSGITLGPTHTNGTGCAGVSSENCEAVDKLALVSECTVLPNSSNDAAARSSPKKVNESNATAPMSDIILNMSAEESKDGLVSLASPRLLGDMEHTNSSGNKIVSEAHIGKLLSPQLSDEKPYLEGLECRQVPGRSSQVISRHPDDDDIEDGEVRDSQKSVTANLLGESKNGNMQDDAFVQDDVFTPSVEPILDIAATLNGSEMVNESENLQEAECSDVSDLSGNPYHENMSSGTVSEEQAPGTPEMLSATGSSSKKAEIVDNAVKNSEKAQLPSRSSNDSRQLSPEDNVGEVDSCKIRSQGSLLLPPDSKANSAINTLKKEGHDQTVELNSPVTDSPSERGKAPNRKPVSSRSEKERSLDRSVKGDASLRRGNNRDDVGNNGPRRVEKERKKDEPFRKAEPGYVYNRGRTDRTWHSDGNPDVMSDRFNNVDSYQVPRHKNAVEMMSSVSADCDIENTGRVMRGHPENDIENFSRVTSRRRSPGGRDRPMGRMIRRRDMSPGRCTDAAGPSDLVLLQREENFMRNLREDMVDSSNFPGPRPNYERGDNSFIRRDMRRRSFSPPMQQRGIPRLPPQMCSPSSRRRPRSPCHWSPPDGFDGHPEAISCRSPPALRVDRIRSPPRRHDLFLEDMVGRRHGSPSPPYANRLQDGRRDVGLQREFNNFARNGRPFRRNTRNFHLMDTEVGGEVEYFGPPTLQSGPLGELPEESMDDGRSCNERHELVRTTFRRYNVPGPGNSPGDEDFNYRIERNPPPPQRPIRFHPEVKEEFPDREDDLPGGYRHRIGEMTTRRLRAADDRGDVCPRNGGPGWQDSSFGDIRLKRRRY